MPKSPWFVKTDDGYPDSDGKPMADDTRHFDWIVMVVCALKNLFREQNVFVAGNLFWYPVRGNPKERSDPDAMVAIGRPPGHRLCYQQWHEDGIAPQVVFEIKSHLNKDQELREKFAFYDRHGVEEYYVLDPPDGTYEAYLRVGDRLRAVALDQLNRFESPRLKIVFSVTHLLRIYSPAGHQYMTQDEHFAEMQRLREEKQRCEESQEAGVAEHQKRAVLARQEFENERNKIRAIIAKVRRNRTDADDIFRQIGFDPTAYE